MWYSKYVNLTPTWRKPSQPNMQNIHPRTEEARKIREAFYAEKEKAQSCSPEVIRAAFS